MRKSKKSNSNTAEICSTYDDDDDFDCSGFTDEPPIGTLIKSFSFDNNVSTNIPIKETNIVTTNNIKASEKQPAPSSTTPIHDNRTNPYPNGITPPRDGESLNIKRTYLLRASTIKKINELRACHPDINVCVSSIVDEAIAFYYNHIINENGTQHSYYE